MKFIKKPNVVVSEEDKRYLSIIRDNVANFILSCGLEYDDESKLILDVAPQDYLGAKGGFKNCKIKTLDIDPLSKADYIADICVNNDRLIKSNTFDYVLCTEVLEHTLNPFKAIAEITRILKKGGYLFISVPFNFRIHGPLPDCWRFTEYGLRVLLADYTVVELKEFATANRDLMPIHYTVIARLD